MSGYEEFIIEPTETTHGGTGFYRKDYDRRKCILMSDSWPTLYTA